MVVFAARDFDAGYELTWVAAVAYTALGFLPAVVVHSTLRRARRAGLTWLLGAAYLASAIAGVMDAVDAARGETPSVAGLRLLTVTYAVLLAVLAVTERRRPGFQRSILAVALAAFAVSALHLSRHPEGHDQDPWLIELIGHHASLPLVLAILYQDYRFAFADVFLKRALSLLALVGLVSLLYATLAAPLVDPHAAGAWHVFDGASHLFTTAALLCLWIATALAYPFIRRRIHRFVDRVILRRADYRVVRAELADELSTVRDPAAALDLASAQLAHALGASGAAWDVAAAPLAVGDAVITLDARRTSARIAIATALAPRYEIRIAELTGGRTLFSDDLTMIEAIAGVLGRRIDELRLEAERRVGEQREQEMQRLATEAELRALRAQLNPHFLFNALNTLGHLMQAAPDRALATLYQLTGLLRAVLRRTNGQFVSVREELDIVESYLAIERERFQERLTVSIEVPQALWAARIPPLLLQPLVENAVKHGIAPTRGGGTVRVHAWRDAIPGEAGFLRFLIVDTGAGWIGGGAAEPGGVGLDNIRSRLQHYFGAAAMMAIRDTPGGGTTIDLCVPWIAVDAPVAVSA